MLFSSLWSVYDSMHHNVHVCMSALCVWNVCETRVYWPVATLWTRKKQTLFGSVLMKPLFIFITLVRAKLWSAFSIIVPNAHICNFTEAGIIFFPISFPHSKPLSFTIENDSSFFHSQRSQGNGMFKRHTTVSRHNNNKKAKPKNVKSHFWNRLNGCQDQLHGILDCPFSRRSCRLWQKFSFFSCDFFSIIRFHLCVSSVSILMCIWKSHR